jgi:UPF0755 protein
MTLHPRYSKKKRQRRPVFHRIILWSITLLIIAALITGYLLYRAIFMPNVWTGEQDHVSVYIPTGSSFGEVKLILYEHGIVVNRNTFEWLAAQKKYDQFVKPGHYVITRGMSNDELINLLRSGNQTPVNVTFNSLRSIEKLASVVSAQIEADSASIASLLNNESYISDFGFNSTSIMSMFIPNTYELWWTTDAKQFIERMYAEYDAFWNESRREKAEKAGLTIDEVVTLASIVEKETNKNDEKPTIAGVYINRLKAGWRLQADPTLIYAWQDYSIKRVLNTHKTIDSPYNTYKHGGLPPGPICIPGISSIDAVLNYEDHRYMFFCASADLSGYHSFAKTSREHNRNARAYQKALDEMKVFK